MSTTAKHYKPLAGDSISNVVKNTISMAKAYNCLVSFNFNGVDLIVGPKSSEENILADWRKKSDANAKAYRESPERKLQDKIAKAKDIAATKRCKKLEDALVNISKDAFHYDLICDWLEAYCDASDRVGVKANISLVDKYLLDTGWKMNAHVGKSKDFFEANYKHSLEWAVGQWLTCHDPRIMIIFAPKIREQQGRLRVNKF